ncbi:MAG: cadherin-like domain-containing protein [Planctomycetales bacterium]
MVLRNWLEGLLTHRPARRVRKNRRSEMHDHPGLETLEIRTLLTDPAFGYAIALGVDGDDMVTSVASDHFGNVAVAGRFHGTVDFAPGAAIQDDTLTSTSGSDSFVAKYDKTGTLLWVKQIANTSQDRDVMLTMSQSGLVYATGQFSGSTEFNSGGGSQNHDSGAHPGSFVVGYNLSGILSFVDVLGGGTAAVDASGITTDLQGNIYASGIIGNGTADLDPSSSTQTVTNTGDGFNTYLVKLNPSGGLVWAETLESDAATAGSSVTSLGLATDSAQNVYMSGFYSHKVDFDPGVGTNFKTAAGSGDDGFLAKFNSSGALSYVVTMGSSAGRDVVNDVAVDSSGIAYVTGRYWQGLTIDDPFNSTPVSGGGAQSGFEGFVAKFDKAGSLFWANSFGSDGLDGGNGIDVNDAGMLYVTGNYSGTVDFDVSPASKTLTSAGGSFPDAFIMRLNTGGALQWVQGFGGGSFDLANKVSADGFGDVYIGGQFLENADLDPTAGSDLHTADGDKYDGFMVKLTQDIVRPEATNDLYYLAANTPLFLSAPGVLANDFPKTGKPLSALLGDLGGTDLHGVLNFSSDGGIEFTPDNNFVGTVTIPYEASDGTLDSDPGSLTIIYGGSFNAPALNTGGDPQLPDLVEDVPLASNNGSLVADIIASMGPNGGITDPDSGALQGLAVIGANQSSGKWQYSTNNGSSWSDFGSTNLHAALLLASNSQTRIRFAPGLNFSGTTGFVAVAWDQTAGTNGTKTSITSAGGSSSFSIKRETVTITVNAANDAPTLVRTAALPALDAINEDEPDSNNPGTLVSDLRSRMQSNGGKITDSDPVTHQGIAVIGANQLKGTWQFSIDGGASWANFGSTSVGNALRLVPDADTRVRFQPKRDYNGDAKFTFVAWDQSDSAANGSFQAITAGGYSAYSNGRQDVQIVVKAVNDAPKLNPNGTPFLTSIPKNITNNNNDGTLVSDIIARMSPNGGITDPDISGSVNGIAIIGADSSHGTWQFTVDSGSTWTDFGTINLGNALLLDGDSDTFIRFEPAPDFTGTAGISFIGWDETEGSTGIFQSIAAAGGTTAFSTGREIALINVT